MPPSLPSQPQAPMPWKNEPFPARAPLSQGWAQGVFRQEQESSLPHTLTPFPVLSGTHRRKI